MEKLIICRDKIPKISELSSILKNETNFTLIPVTGTIPEDLFFKFLSERKFPTICSMRRPNEIDYAEAPDIFHDIFGHIPLLINPIFADFIQECGKKYLQASQLGIGKLITALYWFTIEFGLIKTSKGLRIYGAGIIFSKIETMYSLESPVPTRTDLNISRMIQGPFIYDSFQEIYFIIQSFEELFNIVYNLDLKELHNKYFDAQDKIIITKKKIYK